MSKGTNLAASVHASPTIERMDTPEDPNALVYGTRTMYPLDLADEMDKKIRAGMYWSITTMSEPYAPWSPLPQHGGMETRHCHCSKSRVHRLMCGNIVAVERFAEKCAANCAGMNIEAIVTAHKSRPLDPEDPKHSDGPRTRLGPTEILNDIATKTLGVYATQYILGPNGENYEKAMEMFEVFKKASFTHQKTPRPDLISGDFSCQECGIKAHRDTVPAYHYRNHGYHIIIPIRDQEDVQVVDALKKNDLPDRKGKSARGGKGKGARGGGRGQGGRIPNHILQGRINKHRMEEKKRVLAKIEQDTILDLIGDMALFE